MPCYAIRPAAERIHHSDRLSGAHRMENRRRVDGGKAESKPLDELSQRQHTVADGPPIPAEKREGTPLEQQCDRHRSSPIRDSQSETANGLSQSGYEPAPALKHTTCIHAYIHTNILTYVTFSWDV